MDYDDGIVVYCERFSTRHRGWNQSSDEIIFSLLNSITLLVVGDEQIDDNTDETFGCRSFNDH